MLRRGTEAVRVCYCRCRRSKRPALASRLLRAGNSRRIGSMRRKTVYSAIEVIDRSQLEAFQAGMRKRYSDDHILEELNSSAKRLGRPSTMREFEADPETTVHPQTVIEHYKSWNRSTRLVGLVPRRFATREVLLR